MTGLSIERIAFSTSVCSGFTSQALGSDSIAIFEMPSGEPIATERFSEFKKSFDYYTETKVFESVLKKKMLSSQKPTIYLEGDTDKDYVINYLRLINRSDIIEAIHIDWPGNNDNGTAIGGGKNSLDAIAKLFKAKISLLQTRLLLLHDCDTQKKSEEFQEKLFIRSIPLNEANNNDGIEKPFT